MGRIGRNGQIWKTTNPPGRFTPPRYALRRVNVLYCLSMMWRPGGICIDKGVYA